MLLASLIASSRTERIFTIYSLMACHFFFFFFFSFFSSSNTPRMELGLPWLTTFLIFAVDDRSVTVASHAKSEPPFFSFFFFSSFFLFLNSPVVLPSNQMTFCWGNHIKRLRHSCFSLWRMRRALSSKSSKCVCFLLVSPCFSIFKMAHPFAGNCPEDQAIP